MKVLTVFANQSLNLPLTSDKTRRGNLEPEYGKIFATPSASGTYPKCDMNISVGKRNYPVAFGGGLVGVEISQ